MQISLMYGVTAPPGPPRASRLLPLCPFFVKHELIPREQKEKMRGIVRFQPKNKHTIN